MSDTGNDAFLLVAAIDFGTTFSGYGFSYKSSPNSIYMNKNWGGSVGFQSYKTATCVLTNRYGDFEDFGFDAEKNYKDGENSLFRRFKMLLFESDQLSENSEITALDGTKTPAMEIFAFALRYLKNHLLESIGDSKLRENVYIYLELLPQSKPEIDTVRWIITVPAIWDEEAKQFMRRAAFKAGLIRCEDSRNLVIALEPEAASFYCRRSQLCSSDGAKDVKFEQGTKYMILDCGGGTVDITFHEIKTKDRIKEILRPSGGPWGGVEVDNNFGKFLERVFGATFINTLRIENPNEWRKVMLDFETKKKNSQGKLRLPVNHTFGAIFSKVFSGKLLHEYLNQGSMGVSFKSGHIVIEREKVEQLFAPVTESIVLHIRKLLLKRKVSDVKYILMVGGFSDCVLLQHAVKKAFENDQTKVIIPEDAPLSVIKGAILYGHNPTEIYSRIARYTYGHATCEVFDESKHDPKHRIVDGGEVLCDSIFSAFVIQDDEIRKGTVASEEIEPNTIKQRSIQVRILKLDGKPKKPVQYTDDPRVKVMGTVLVKVPSDVKDRTMEVAFTFGGTEIKVDVKSIATGITTTAHIDFQHDR